MKNSKKVSKDNEKDYDDEEEDDDEDEDEDSDDSDEQSASLGKVGPDGLGSITQMYEKYKKMQERLAKFNAGDLEESATISKS